MKVTPMPNLNRLQAQWGTTVYDAGPAFNQQWVYKCFRLQRGTGMIASSSTFRPHPGRVIRDLFRLLDAVYGIVRKH